MQASDTTGPADAPLRRCAWAEATPEMAHYHDTEWGVPVREDRVLFEFLTLEAAQAGLSWLTILRKREGYRRAFAGFDAAVVARFGADDEARLLADAGIVRNRAKIRAAISNARCFLEVQQEFGTFAGYIWRFVGDKPRVNRPRTLQDIATTSPESDSLAADLRKRGFRFLGSTVVYAHMQATGMVNDHLVGCFRQRVTGGP